MVGIGVSRVGIGLDGHRRQKVVLDSGGTVNHLDSLIFLVKEIQFVYFVSCVMSRNIFKTDSSKLYTLH